MEISHRERRKGKDGKIPAGFGNEAVTDDLRIYPTRGWADVRCRVKEYKNQKNGREGVLASLGWSSAVKRCTGGQ